MIVSFERPELTGYCTTTVMGAVSVSHVPPLWQVATLE